jgi:methylmalonyl-CoA/ethylmalonyl-CoA epimerase
MDILGVEHIGIAVANLDETIRRFEAVLGIKCSSRQTVASSKVDVAVFEVGDTKIELITPAVEGSPVAKFLAQRGDGIHHVCLKVKDIAACLEELKGKGVDLIDKAPRQGAFGHAVAFLSPKSVSNILVELSESE